MDDNDFLDAVEADNAGTTALEDEQLQVEAVEPQPEPAPMQEQQPEPEPVQTPEPVQDARPEPGHVPISALLDEREKRKAEADARAKLEAEIQSLRQPQPQAEIPDMLEDPEGFLRYQSDHVRMTALNVKLDMSEEMARTQLGDEAVDKARDWALQEFQRRPGFQQEVFNQRNPYGYLVQQYQRDQIAASVSTDDFQQFQAWKAAQATIAQQQQAATAAPSTSAIPPKSLASAPSAGGVTTAPAQTDAEIFAETFARN